jgi:transposase
VLLPTEGQMSDHRGATLVLPAFPPASELIGDRRYDSRKVEIPYDKALHRERHRIENTLGRLKDWRRVATRYDRCAHTFFSAICVAATVTFWLA